MEAAMDNIQDTINHLKRRIPAMEVDENFENAVFSKIKRKKRQRKITASVAAGVMLAAVLFVGQAVIFNETGNGNRSMLAGSQTNRLQKEEVPVVEDVVFASSDSGSDYVIEQVGYTSDDGTL